MTTMTMRDESVNGTTMREEFGAKALTRTGETTQTALAAAAQATVNARYIMAMQRPRSWDDVRVRILNECKRRGFAEVARYAKPIGQDKSKWPRGPSIRFAEACLRYAGNLGVETVTAYEDRSKRMLRVTASDYETNAHVSHDITIEKTVERRNAKDRVIVGERANSYGDKVYIVEATEDDLLNKQNAAVSKAARNGILRLIPGDIVEEAMSAVTQTLNAEATKDPAGEKKRVCDAFATLGVMPKDLADYLGHSLDAVQPAELVDLREIFATMRDGETTWAAVIEAKNGARASDGEKPAAAAKQASGIAEKVKARKAAPKPSAPVVDTDGVVTEDAAAAAPDEREPGSDDV